MGACLSSHRRKNSAFSVRQLRTPIDITIAFPTSAPLVLTVARTDKLWSIRKRVISEMERRAEQAQNFSRIEGKLVTVDCDTGDNVYLRDSMTVYEARLEPRQYLWFQDQSEDTRLQNLLIRSSRLTENTLHNSRGVKKGMALMKDEVECDGTY